VKPNKEADNAFAQNGTIDVAVARWIEVAKRDWDTKSETRTLRYCVHVLLRPLIVRFTYMYATSAGVGSNSRRGNMAFAQLPCRTKRLLINVHGSASNKDRCVSHRICPGITGIIFISCVSRTKIKCSCATQSFSARESKLNI